jgi:predicted DNA-binding protein
MSQVETAAPIAFPSTTEELRAFVAGTMTEVLNIPENKAIQAESLLGFLLGLVQERRAKDDRAQFRPVVVSTYYRGAARATCGVKEGEFFVQFEEEAKDADGKLVLEAHDVNGVSMTRPVWKAMPLEAGPLEMLTKLVLSQPVQPGQVFYVTTAAGIEAHMEAMTDMFQATDATRTKLDGASKEELLASGEAQAFAEAQ